MSDIYGNLQETETYVDFDYDAIDAKASPSRDNSALDALTNWCSYVSADLRLEKMSEKAFVFSRFLGVPQKVKSESLTADECLAVTEKLNQLGLCDPVAQRVFIPIVSWMTQGISFKAIGERNLVFVYCIEKSFLPFSTLEDLGIWIGVSKIRIQHLITEFHIALNLRYKTNKTKEGSKASQVLEARVQRARKALVDKLNEGK